MFPKQAKQGQGYPLLVKGDIKVIQRIKLFLHITLSLPKNIQISVPFIPKSKQITPLLEPTINIQIIDEPVREQIMKGKYQLRTDTFYIYYPCQFRVEEKVYRSLIKSFQNLVDQVPRNVKPYVHRLIIWEDAKGQHTIQMQKQKINEALSELAKQLIQSKLNSLVSEIRQYQTQPSTQKSLLHIFLLKNKLACLYSHLSLKNFAHDLYADVWNQMMVNFRCLMRFTSATKLGSSQKLEAPEDIPRTPYTFQNTNDILGYFQNTHSTAYLRIVTHAFMKFYSFSLSLGLIFQAITKLKSFLDFILNNILVLSRRNQWTKQQMKQFDIARNLWAIEIIFKSLKQLDERNNAESNRNNQVQISKVHVSICSMLRNSIERIGLVLYQFDNYSIFPGCIKKQLDLILQKTTKLRQPWRVYKHSIESLGQQNVEQPVLKTTSLMKREQFVLKVPETGPNQIRLKQLISHKLTPPQQITKLLINFQAYSQVYLKALQAMYTSLKNSPYIRVAKSLKMTLERATIMLGDWQDYQKVIDELEQFKDFWPELHSIQKLYRLFFIFVKLLADELPSTKIISDQLVQVLKDKYLRQQQQKVYSLTNEMLQTFQSHHVKCNLAVVHKLELKQDLEISAILKGGDISQILGKAQNWNLITQQTMLNENVKRYELTKIKTRQFKKCEKCTIQCTNLCSALPQKYTELICKVQLEKSQHQALFYIKQLSFNISAQYNRQQLYIQVPKHIQKHLYKINIPKLQIIKQIRQKNNYIFPQVWTPLIFCLNSFKEAVVFNNVQAAIKRNSNYLQQQLVEGTVKWLNANNQQKDKQQSQFCLSQYFYLSKEQNVKNQPQNYHKLSQNLDIPVSQSSQPYFLAFFVKSRKLEKIQRNSRKKIDQTQTDQQMVVNINLTSTSLNKQYRLQAESSTFCITPLLQLQYNIVQTYEQFLLTNLHLLSITIKQNSNQSQFQKQSQAQFSFQTEQSSLYQLDNSESVCIQSRFIWISPSDYLHMKVHINLNDWFDAESLIQNKCNTFRISYRAEHSYKLFKPIQIQSEIVGNIDVPYLESSTETGFQLIGKVKGTVQYLQEKLINLWLIPIKTGNIILPEIEINGKKGIWVNSLITNIEAN